MKMQNTIPYSELVVGEKRFFCDIQLSFGEFEITKYFVKITEIKKQVAKYTFLFNEKVTGSNKISDMMSWATDKELMRKYFVEKIQNNLIEFKEKLMWYSDKYPKLEQHKSHIKTLEFLLANVDRIFSEDTTFRNNLKIQQGYILDSKHNIWSKKK